MLEEKVENSNLLGISSFQNDELAFAGKTIKKKENYPDPSKASKIKLPPKVINSTYLEYKPKEEKDHENPFEVNNEELEKKSENSSEKLDEEEDLDVSLQEITMSQCEEAQGDKKYVYFPKKKKKVVFV